MRSPKISKKAKCHLDLDLALPLDQQHMLTSLAAGKNDFFDMLVENSNISDNIPQIFFD